jgi:hypothetical protein
MSLYPSKTSTVVIHTSPGIGAIPVKAVVLVSEAAVKTNTLASLRYNKFHLDILSNYNIEYKYLKCTDT